ncbi:antibiotic biosynthesis monooxygenase [bacterium]|nr:antibiotic biosynthesis monooxygenase [bacterium]
MIIVRITLNVLPEKQLEFTQTLLSMIEATEMETGCLSYGVYSDIEDKNCYNLLEEWETREDLNHHMRSHRFSVLLGSKTLLCKPLKIQIFTVAASEGIEAVNSSRETKNNLSG